MSRENAATTTLMDKRVVLITIVLTLGNLAICIHRSSRIYLYQQSQCLQHYLALEPQKVDVQSEVEERFCKIKEVQSPLSIIEGVDTFLMLLPALLVLSTYQKLMPIIGYRRLMMINLFFVGLGILLSILFYSFHQPWTTYGILLTFICDLLGGGDLVRITMSVTIIAAILQPEKLTDANNYISSLYVFASVTGSAIGSALLSHHVYILNLLGIVCAFLAMFIALFIPEGLGRRINVDQSIASSTTDFVLSDISPSSRRSSSEALEKPQPIESIPRILTTSWKSSLYSVITLFRVDNPTFTVILIFFVFSCAIRVEVLIAQYISLTLHWTLAKVNALLTVKALVAALALLAIPTIRGVFLEPRMEPQEIDLFIMQASLIPNAMGMLGFGFSLPAGLFILSLMVYNSGCGLYASLTTFGHETLAPPEKPSDFFVRNGLAQTIAGLISAPLWSFLFSMCLRNEWLPLGLPFWISAGMFVGIIVLTRTLKGWAKYSAIPEEE